MAAMTHSIPIKVLLIEDDEDDYILTCSLLKEITHTPFDIEWIRTYELALARITQNHHQVCLVDYRLGRHNGLDLLRAAAAAGSRMPMILLTGQNDHTLDMEAMKTGASMNGRLLAQTAVTLQMNSITQPAP